MAERDDAQERSEQASQKRLREAREKGDVPRSRDLTAAAVTCAAIAALLMSRGHIGSAFRALMHDGLDLPRAALDDPAGMTAALRTMALRGFMAAAPVLGVAALAALLAPMALGGVTFSSEALGFKGERLDPLAGLGRIFSSRGLVELGKALLKFTIAGAVTGVLLWQAMPGFLRLGTEPLAGGVGHALDLIAHAAAVLAGTLLVLGALDVPWQLYDYAKRLRMTREELKEEFKETEGRPEVKQRIRQVQQQMARKRMMQEVPRADVVVTNPTHYAVALRYDDARMRAPQVVAKGVDLMAQQIRAIAAAHGIPQLEAPPLARALYASTTLGGEIPAALYVAVAEVMSWVFRLRRAGANGDDAPVPPQPDVDPALDPLTATEE